VWDLLWYRHQQLQKIAQWGGVGMVFAGIGGNMWGKHQKSQAAKRAHSKDKVCVLALSKYIAALHSS
jgi:hypothetical protein